MLNPTDMALTLARAQILQLDRHERTDTKLLEIAQSAAAMLAPAAGIASLDEVTRQLQAEFDVWVPQAVVVSDPGNHEPWLEKQKTSDHLQLLEPLPDLSAEKLQTGGHGGTLNETTDQILGLMENPQRPGHWSTYGSGVRPGPVG